MRSTWLSSHVPRCPRPRRWEAEGAGEGVDEGMAADEAVEGAAVGAGFLQGPPSPKGRMDQDNRS